MTTPAYPPAPGPVPVVQPVPQPVPPTFQPQPPVPLPAYEQPAQTAPQAPAAVRIPEGGYALRVVRVPLPEFALAGLPEPWVEMRNPGLMSQEALEGMMEEMRAVKIGDDGEPTDVADVNRIFGQVLKLVRDWCMWDGGSDEDVPPLLPKPTTLAVLRRAPAGALKKIMETFQELQNPQ